jgi:hypothetical protein
VPINTKLFRAIVVMGVSMTASCDEPRCHHCLPPPTDADGNGAVDAKVADATRADAGVDGPPVDAPVDTVLIL